MHAITKAIFSELIELVSSVSGCSRHAVLTAAGAVLTAIHADAALANATTNAANSAINAAGAAVEATNTHGQHERRWQLLRILHEHPSSAHYSPRSNLRRIRERQSGRR